MFPGCFKVAKSFQKAAVGGSRCGKVKLFGDVEIFYDILVKTSLVPLGSQNPPIISLYVEGFLDVR